MSIRSMRLWLATALTATFSLLSPAHAEVITFESAAPSVFVQGETFAQGGYSLTVNGDYGVVDTVAACYIISCPTGNDTAFYYGVNDGRLLLTRNGGLFDLLGFDAAFLAPYPQPAGVDAGQIRISALDSNGTRINAGFAFAVSDDLGFAFTTYSGSALSAFRNIVSVEFLACTYDTFGLCLNVNQNLSQFTLDNLQVVPEPASVALMGLGLGALLLAGRRQRARPSSQQA
jgi:PEP-CTERM motif